MFGELRNDGCVHDEGGPQPLVSATDVEAARLDQLHGFWDQHRLGWQAVEPLEMGSDFLCDLFGLEVLGLTEL